jgi:hypothetical protein
LDKPLQSRVIRHVGLLEKKPLVTCPRRGELGGFSAERAHKVSVLEQGFHQRATQPAAATAEDDVLCLE